MPIRGQEVSVIVLDNLKEAFVFHHWWRCTLDWEVTELNEQIVHFLVGQEKLKDEYEEFNVLWKINKSDMAGMIESIKEYLRACCGIFKAPLAYIIRKTIIVQTFLVINPCMQLLIIK